MLIVDEIIFHFKPLFKLVGHWGLPHLQWNIQMPIVYEAIAEYCRERRVGDEIIHDCWTAQRAGAVFQLHQQVERSHLAALAGADPVVVSWRLVLAHEAGLVDPGRGQRRGGAGDQLLRAAALSLDGWRENVEVTKARFYFVML